MNIQDILSSNPHGLAIISLSDLKEFLREIVKEVDNENRVEKEEYYSSDQVMRRLKISEPTLYRWTKDKYLPSVKVGHRNLYPKSQVESLLKFRTSTLGSPETN